ncbi:MAG: hypothetical protein ACI9MC_001730 [Kiritimatiellia bacterium]|jgi:hypothetical protein
MNATRWLITPALLCALGAGCEGEDAPTDTDPDTASEAYDGVDVAWKDKNNTQRIVFMTNVVLPDMKPRLEPFLEGEVTCSTCHGENPSQNDYAMPSVFALDVQNFPEPGDSDMTKAMYDEIRPAMAGHLGREIFSNENPAGFSCFGCHTRP